jgi:spermidine dehydrogenase
VNSRDRELGMHRKITRRDFINGVAVTAGAAMMPWHLFAANADQNSPNYYPPALTGMRGSHPGSFETAHSLRDGTFWDSAGKPEDTGETYDLIVVGGGISGLSAAHFYRKTAGAKARILILDNHDDFGGHAKRNEFRVNNAFRLGFGGTFSIESPAPYSPVAKGVIEELGIDVPSYSKYFAKNLYPSFGLHPKIFFDKETFGSDKLATNFSTRGWTESEDKVNQSQQQLLKQFLAEAPIAEQAKRDLQRLYEEPKDYFPGLTSDEKKAKLARVSYANFLKDTVGVHDDVVKIYQALPHGLFGVGIDAVAAQDAWGLGLPGFDGMKLEPGAGKGMNRDCIPNEEAEKYFFHFPDGNASIARMLVQKLIPQAIPGSTAADIVLAKANYAKLDAAGSPVRIRLSSTAVRVKHIGDAASAKEVEVTYARGGKVYTAKGKNSILACWHVVIPYICEDLPSKQKEALASAQKVPLLYTNVAIKNWTAFQKVGANAVYAPGMYHTGVNLDLPVSIGGYECAQKPDEPIVVHMMKAACHPGLPARQQHVYGRMELYTTTFETMERNIRDQLARTLNGSGFDPARDIAAITVNRWPHGYAYEYNSLFDSFWLEGGETPCEIARKPFGRIAIANADAGAYAYTDEAINQAYRAVSEITKG